MPFLCTYRNLEFLNHNVFEIFRLKGISNVRLYSKKPYYVTTPIFYVNAAPHIGHLHSMVLANTLKHWDEFVNPSFPKPFLTTGTDEHGLKVQRASEAVKIDTKEFVDNASGFFKMLANEAKIDYNRFIRTTDEDHIKASCYLWNKLKTNGFIYKGEHSGWYCISDETFYPESQIEKKTLEDGTETVISIETGKVVEWSSEENYFFALSKIQPQLLEFLETKKDFIVPEKRYKQIIDEVRSGLSDISISRPKSRCSWGIPVPGSEDSQVMYVWLDALTNYLTSSGFPWSQNEQGIWPANVHVIGKDIIRFHTIYWPGFLLAANLPLPKNVVVHSHWTMKGSKMSKSLGNVIDPIVTMHKFGVDTVKFFLLNDSYLSRDSDYSNDRVINRHNTELVNKYGNLIVRICGKVFNIRRAISTKDTAFTNRPLVNEINNLSSKVQKHMKLFNTASALSEVWSLISFANTYVQDSAPWAVKTNLEKQDAIIKDVSEAARVSSILLTPFIPIISHTMLDRLGVSVEKRGIDYAFYGADNTYGENVNRKGNYPIKPIEVPSVNI